MNGVLVYQCSVRCTLTIKGDSGGHSNHYLRYFDSKTNALSITIRTQICYLSPYQYHIHTTQSDFHES